MRALIAMSGGVDSSVSAKIMKDLGYECVGCTMRLYENDIVGLDLLDTCCSLKDTEDARSVTNNIGIPYHIFHYENEFRQKVIEPFIESYEKGETPNPCINCNKCLKFSRLFEKMEKFDCDTLVTGHYARIEKINDRYILKKALDETKDQSYVLYNLTQEELAKIKFPLGEYTKNTVRNIANENKFINAKKHDSQDICFVPNGDYEEFINRYRGHLQKEGNFIDKNGNILGIHKGIAFYTIGQRKGLGISTGKPLYVIKINPKTNEITLGDNKDLFEKEVFATNINLISVDKIESPMRIKAKIRYRQKESLATAIQLDNNTLKVVFDEPVRAVTPGQALVLYDGDIVVGGGTIFKNN